MTAVVFALLLAVTPAIREISPAGAQRGKSAKVVLKGDGLTPGAKIITTIPGSVTKMIGENFTLLVELKPDAEVGLYPLRVLTEDGLSNLVLFSVGSLPEVEEAEDEHGSRAEAQKIAVPLTVNAALEGPEIDYYAIDLPAPRKLVVEIDARRAGSAIDPAFEIEDAQGKVIARNDDAPGCGVDARMEVSFPRAGRYFIRVHDSKFSTQTTDFYRLKIGQWQFAEALFPLGGTPGGKIEVRAIGGNLPKELPLSVEIDRNVPSTPVRIPGSASLPLLALASAPPIEHRRFAKPGDKLEIPLRVEPGESWIVEVAGRAAGASLAEPFATVLGPDGKKIASRDDIANPNLGIPFTVPKDVREVKIVIEELLGRGGPQYGYQFAVRRSPADFVAAISTPFVNVPAGGTAIVPVEIRRRGYDGPVKFSIPDIPPGIKVAGGNIPSEAAGQSFNNDNAGFRTSRGMLTLTADPNIEPKFSELKVVAVAETPQGPIVREARGPGMSVTVRGLRQNAVTAPWLGMKLPFATARALPVTLALQSPAARISQGVEYPMSYRVERRAGAKAVEKIRDSQVNSVGNLRVLQSDPNLRKNPDSGTLMLQTNFGSPVTKFDMLVLGDAEINGKMQTVYAPAIEVDIVAGYQLMTDGGFSARAGSDFELKGSVYREPTFEGGAVKVEAQELPEGVSCGAADVVAESRDFVLPCKASPKAAAGEYEIFLSSSAPEVGKKAKAEYKIAPLAVKLKVGN